MCLTDEQQKMVKAWVAAGLKDGEIIRRASEQVPPFKLTKQNISKNYRRHTERRIREMRSQEEEDSILRTGLALRENRVRELEELYRLAMEDVRHSKDGRVRQGMANVCRGCLDDIAKELGERREKLDVEASVHRRDIIAIMERVYGDGGNKK